VVVVERLAPAPFADDAVPVSAAITDGLSEQLDLRRIEGVNQALLFYENSAWVPSRAAVPASSTRVPDPADAAAVLTDQTAASRFEGPVDAGADIHVATSRSTAWRLTVDGEVAARGDGYGWENRFTPLTQGEAVLEYRTPVSRRGALIAQAIGWVVVLALLVNRRRAHHRDQEAGTA
jgi:hypothetical protein